MASVPLSATLQAGIIANSILPFNTIIENTLELINNDEELAHLACNALGDEEQTAMAYKLFAQSPLWFKAPGSSLRLLLRGKEFQLDTDIHPYPLAAYHSNVIDLDADPDLYSALRARLNLLRIPIDRAEIDKTAIHNSLIAIFEQCNTLQHVVEVMPTALNWVPTGPDDTYLTRYRASNAPRKPKRATAEEIRASTLSDAAIVAIARAKTT